MISSPAIALGSLVVAAVSWLAPTAGAGDSSALSLSGGSNTAGFTQSTLLGFDFVPAEDISVSALGVIDTIQFTADGSGDGLATVMPVGLYRVDTPFSGTLLKRVDLPAGESATLIGDFRYVEFEPIELEAGQEYRILTIYLSSGSEGSRSSFLADVQVDPILTGFQSTAVQSNDLTDLQFNGSPAGGGIAHTSGPNLRFTTVGPPACAADLAPPVGVLNFFDLGEFFTRFNAQEPSVDFAAPFGVWNFFDLGEFLSLFNQGCP